MARRLMGTKHFLKSRDERKRVEMRFAHLKTHHGFERMRLRGLSGARDEFHLAAIVQNLKTSALRILGPPSARRRFRLPEIAHDASQSRPRRSRRQSSGRKTQQSARLSRVKTTQQHNANRKTYFFNSIGHQRPFRDVRY